MAHMAPKVLSHTSWILVTIGASAGAIMLIGVEKFVPGAVVKLLTPWGIEADGGGLLAGGNSELAEEVAILAKTVKMFKGVHVGGYNERGFNKVALHISLFAAALLARHINFWGLGGGRDEYYSRHEEAEEAMEHRIFEMEMKLEGMRKELQGLVEALRKNFAKQQQNLSPSGSNRSQGHA